jgi:hypothetical protein
VKFNQLSWFKSKLTQDLPLGDYIMSNNSNNSEGETLSPLLVILVAGSISLAIVNKANHPAYFDIVKIAMVYSFGSIKSQGKSKHSNNQDEVNKDELK